MIRRKNTLAIPFEAIRSRNSASLSGVAAALSFSALNALKEAHRPAHQFVPWNF
jgi:hypothetical protein